MKPDYAHITLLIDESGSMHSLHADTVGGVNTFLNEQKAAPGTATITLTTFNHVTTDRFVMANITDVPAFEPQMYHPSGVTALLDALGRAILHTGDALAQMPEADRPSKVVVAIITDGEENSSVEFSIDRIKQMVEHQQSVYNWTFVFMGANIDAFTTGATYGFAQDAILTYDAAPDQLNATYVVLSSSVARVRNGEDMVFTSGERAQTVKI